MNFPHPEPYRRKPVGQPRRNIPVLRVLLLLGCGIFVATRFDAFWSRTGAGKRAQPEPAAAAADHWKEMPIRFVADSIAIVDCRAAGGAQECCASLSRLSPDLSGEVLSVLAKAIGRLSLGDAISLTEIRASVPADGQGVLLVSLEGRDAKGAYRYGRRENPEGDGPGAWCDARRGCLARPAPQPPLKQAVAIPDAPGNSWRWVGPKPEVYPALPGRVVRVDTARGFFQVTVYHGGEVYTHYDPLARLAPDVAAGSETDPRHPLGMAADDSSGYRVEFRAERVGLPLDPAEFYAWEGTHDP